MPDIDAYRALRASPFVSVKDVRQFSKIDNVAKCSNMLLFSRFSVRGLGDHAPEKVTKGIRILSHFS